MKCIGACKNTFIKLQFKDFWVKSNVTTCAVCKRKKDSGWDERIIWMKNEALCISSIWVIHAVRHRVNPTAGLSRDLRVCARMRLWLGCFAPSEKRNVGCTSMVNKMYHQLSSYSVVSSSVELYQVQIKNTHLYCFFLHPFLLKSSGYQRPVGHSHVISIITWVILTT